MKSIKNYLVLLCLTFAFALIAQDSINADEIIQSELTTEEQTTTETAPSVAVEEAVEIEPNSIGDNVFGDLPGKITDLISSLEWYDFLFILIFNLLGYLSPFIPVLRKIGDTEIRVGVGAIVLIMIFVAMDINTAWKLVIEFFVSTKLYEKVFSLIKKTDTPAAPTVAITS